MTIDTVVMSNAAATIASIRSRGARVRVADGDVGVTPATTLTAEDTAAPTLSAVLKMDPNVIARRVESPPQLARVCSCRRPSTDPKALACVNCGSSLVGVPWTDPWIIKRAEGSGA